MLAFVPLWVRLRHQALRRWRLTHTATWTAAPHDCAASMRMHVPPASLQQQPLCPKNVHLRTSTATCTPGAPSR